MTCSNCVPLYMGYTVKLWCGACKFNELASYSLSTEFKKNKKKPTVKYVAARRKGESELYIARCESRSPGTENIRVAVPIMSSEYPEINGLLSSVKSTTDKLYIDLLSLFWRYFCINTDE